MRAVILAMICCCLAGCSVIRHKDQILLLKDLGANQARMDSYVAQQKKTFLSLKHAVIDDRLRIGMNKQYIESRYGQAALCKPGEKQAEACIYRPPVSGLLAEMVYLFYTPQQTLSGWEYHPAINSQNSQDQ